VKERSDVQNEQEVQAPAPQQPARKKSVIRDYAESIVMAVLIAFVIRTYIVQPFTIPSGSMEDTLLVGDYLLVNKFIYGVTIPFTDKRILSFRQPGRGDVVVFLFPEDALNERLFFWQKKDFIKRIVGLPGDRVKMVDQVVYVNGSPYRIPQEIHKGGQGGESPLLYDMEEIVVPAGQYFVMGDNRDRSYDSRFWGFVPFELIRGKAFIKHWSWDAEQSSFLRKLTSIRWNRIGRPIQ
jgi:signal peptidase I